MSAIVERRGDGWYFWDESAGDSLGPFPSKDWCERALDEYVRTVHEGMPPNQDFVWPLEARWYSGGAR